MAYKLLAAFVAVKDARGKIRHHYPHGGGATDGGPIIPWLNDQQRAHFLRHKLVEEIGPDHPLWDAAQAVAKQAEIDATQYPVTSSGYAEYDDESAVAVDVGVSAPGSLVDECIAKLDQLGVESQAGNPTAREALRGAKISYGNEVIAAAVRYRKARAA